MKTEFNIPQEVAAQAEAVHRSGATFQIRRRGEFVCMILRGLSKEEITKALSLSYVSLWRWNVELASEPGLFFRLATRSGRPKPLAQEVMDDIASIQQEKYLTVKQMQAVVLEKHGVAASSGAIKQVYDENCMVWKRMRRSLKSKRNQAAFEAGRKLLAALMQEYYEKKRQVFFYDESGFCLTPYIPYRYIKKGGSGCIPSSKSKCISIMGFLSPECAFEGYQASGAVDSKTIIAVFNDFFTEQRKKTNCPITVVVDNAPTHKSSAFKAMIPVWAEMGCTIHYIPPYSPELNIIEMLWKSMKYHWIEFEAYISMEKLQEYIDSIVKGIGKEYVMNFDEWKTKLAGYYTAA